MDNNISASIVSIPSNPLAVIEKKSDIVIDVTPITTIDTPKLNTTDSSPNKRGKNPNSLKNLIRIKKGQKLVGAGRPKGAISTKKALEKLLKDKNVYNIANTIIQGAEQGKDKKIQTLLMLRGELDNNPQINIQNNNLNVIDSTLLQQALEYLKQNGTSS